MFWQAAEAELMHDRGVHFRFAVVRLPSKADGKRDSSLTMLRPASLLPDAKEVKFTGSWTEARVIMEKFQTSGEVENKGQGRKSRALGTMPLLE